MTRNWKTNGKPFFARNTIAVFWSKVIVVLCATAIVVLCSTVLRELFFGRNFSIICILVGSRGLDFARKSANGVLSGDLRLASCSKILPDLLTISFIGAAAGGGSGLHLVVF